MVKKINSIELTVLELQGVKPDEKVLKIFLIPYKYTIATLEILGSNFF